MPRMDGGETQEFLERDLTEVRMRNARPWVALLGVYEFALQLLQGLAQLSEECALPAGMIRRASFARCWNRSWNATILENPRQDRPLPDATLPPTSSESQLPLTAQVAHERLHGKR
jgi:hypothetical protein